MPLDNYVAIMQEFAGSDQVITAPADVIAGGPGKVPWIAAGSWHWDTAASDSAEFPSTPWWRSLVLQVYYTETTRTTQHSQAVQFTEASPNSSTTVNTTTTYRYYRLGFDPNNGYFDDDAAEFRRFLAAPTEILAPLWGGGENDQVSPNSLLDGALTLGSVAALMQTWSSTFTKWAGELNVESGDWSGTAAGVFKQVLNNFAMQMQIIHDEVEASGAVDAMSEAGIQLTATAGRLYSTWLDWASEFANSPRAALADVWRDEISNPLVLQHQWTPPTVAEVKQGRAPELHLPAYGNPASQSFWDHLMVRAHDRWLERIEELNAKLRTELPTLDSAYQNAAATFPESFPLPPGTGGPGGTNSSQMNDTDGDGIPDEYQTDSDGDGIPDMYDMTPNGDDDETDADGDNIPDQYQTDSDGDGIPDMYDITPNGEEEEQEEPFTDEDHDNIPDEYQVDTDGDGIPDMYDTTPNGEAEGTDETSNSGPIDSDGDGIPDEYFVDTDGDGIPDIYDATPDGPEEAADHGSAAVDTDGDGILDEDSPDTDGDLIPDRYEVPTDGEGPSAQSDVTGMFSATAGQDLSGADGAVPGAAGPVVGTDGQMLAAGQLAARTAASSLSKLTGSGQLGTGEEDGTVQLTDAEGNPVLDSRGRPITAPSGSVIEQDGSITTPDGISITDSGGRAVTAPPGAVLTATTPISRPDGSLVTGTDGLPVTVPEGSSITSSGQVVSADGTRLTDLSGQPLTVPAGSELSVPRSSTTRLASTVPAGSTPGAIDLDTSRVQLPTNENLPGSLQNLTSGTTPEATQGSTPGTSGRSSTSGLLGGGSEGLGASTPAGTTARAISNLLSGGFESSPLNGSVPGSSGQAGTSGSGAGSSLTGSGGGLGGLPGQSTRTTSSAPLSSSSTRAIGPEITPSQPSNLQAPGVGAADSQMLNRVSTSSNGTPGEGQMMPPMTGGAGAPPGATSQNGNRKTWVTEDEDVWGTGTATSSGVLGR